MKKIELHCHLDGSLDPAFATHLANREVKTQMVGKGSKTLGEFLEKFTLPIQLLQTESALEEFSQLLAQALALDEVIYAEIRFCPLLHVKQGLTPNQVIASVLRGLRRVPEVKTNLILCLMRNFSFSENNQIINIAQEWLGRGVCAIDLAGDEATYPTAGFEELFHRARVSNIPFTIHAGEADGPASIEAALRFGAQRIGHGVRAAESPAVVERLKKQRIAIEVCPTSNFDTGVYQHVEDYPIKRLLREGVAVTISTDNRTVSDTSLAQEYQFLQERFGFTPQDFLRCNINAALSAFLPAAEKVELVKELLADADYMPS